MKWTFFFKPLLCKCFYE